MTLQARGIHYDVGHEYLGQGPGNTRPHFDQSEVKAELATIANELHANAVRVAGTDLTRLKIAAKFALDAGLDVWFSPHPGDLRGDAVVDYLVEAAGIAELLRSQGEPVVLVAGCELSLFANGFLPGATLDDRLKRLLAFPTSSELVEAFAQLPQALNGTLGQILTAARSRFRGSITYASAPWEQIDWTLFDLVSVDLYRDASNATIYRQILRSYLGWGKPVAVTEFGCCTYQGAAEAGGLGFDIVDYQPQPPLWRLKVPGPERNEAVQARYLAELVGIFEEEGIHGAFWHTFAGWTFPHRPDPNTDLDLASFGLVRVIETAGDKTKLEPKLAFATLAAAYAKGDHW